MKTSACRPFNLYLIFTIFTVCCGTGSAEESWRIEPEKDKYTVYLNNFDAKDDSTIKEQVNLVSGKFGKGAEVGKTLTVKCSRLSQLDAKEGFVEFWLKPDWSPQKKEAVRNLVKIFFSKGEITVQKIGSALNFSSNFNNYRHSWYPIVHWEKDQWHHLGIYWVYSDGFTNYQLYVDGKMACGFTNSLATGKLEKIVFGHHKKTHSADAVIDGLRISSVLRHIVLRAPEKLPVTARLLTSGKACRIVSQHPAVKILPDRKFPPDLPAASSISIKAAKGEYESIQIAVVPDKRIENVKIKFSDLTGPGVIGKDNLSFRAVETVEVELPSNQFGGTGNFPDPLPPVKEFNFEAQKNNTIWITLRVPVDAEAGNYNGTVTLENPNGFSETIKLNLKVWNFTLPGRSSIKTVGLGWFNNIAKYEKSDPVTLYKRANRSMAEHRYAGFGYTNKFVKIADGNLTIDSGQADMWSRFIIDELGMYIFPFPAIPYISHKGKHVFPEGQKWAGIKMFVDEKKGVLNPEFEKIFSEKIKKLTDFFHTKNRMEYPVAYFVDELNFDDDETLNKVLAINKLLKKSIPWIKIMHTRYPDKRLLATTDIWCVNSQHYLPYKKEIAMGRESGAEIWVYYNSVAQIDLPLMRVRMFSWFLKKENIDGHFSWWGLAAYYNDDPWKKKWKSNAGSGVLLYPGRNEYEKQFSPISSMRWETMRDGLEDYEYLHLLKINADKQNDDAGKKLYREAVKLVADGEYQTGAEQVYCLDVEKLEEMRCKIAENIVRLINLKKNKMDLE